MNFVRAYVYGSYYLPCVVDYCVVYSRAVEDREWLKLSTKIYTMIINWRLLAGPTTIPTVSAVSFISLLFVRFCIIFQGMIYSRFIRC